MLEEAKKILRVSNDIFDSEIQTLLDAAVLDLNMAGILESKTSDPDALVTRALLTYVKANFGWDNAESERLINAYVGIKRHLLLSRDYTEEA